jgi:hypothetical protein
MPRKTNLNVSTSPPKPGLSSAERNAIRIAETASRQGELKREAAERRAKRDNQAGAGTAAAAASALPGAEPTSKP